MEAGASRTVVLEGAFLHLHVIWQSVNLRGFLRALDMVSLRAVELQKTYTQVVQRLQALRRAPSIVRFAQAPST